MRAATRRIASLAMGKTKNAAAVEMGKRRAAVRGAKSLQNIGRLGGLSKARRAELQANSAKNEPTENNS